MHLFNSHAGSSEKDTQPMKADFRKLKQSHTTEAEQQTLQLYPVRSK